MKEKAEYRSAIRSRKMIKQAFVELMHTKDIQNITVTDVVRHADINRGTFYAHYQNTRAVLEEIENEIIDKMLEFLDDFHNNNFLQNPLPLLLKVARYLEENFEFYHILITAKGSEQFIKKLVEIFVDYMEKDEAIPASKRNEPDFIININFFAGGIVNLYQSWFIGDLKQSLDDISLVISKIITGSYAAAAC